MRACRPMASLRSQTREPRLASAWREAGDEQIVDGRVRPPTPAISRSWSCRSMELAVECELGVNAGHGGAREGGQTRRGSQAVWSPLIQSPWAEEPKNIAPRKVVARDRPCPLSQGHQLSDPHHRLFSAHTLVSSKVIDYLDRHAAGGARGHGNQAPQMRVVRAGDWQRVLELSQTGSGMLRFSKAQPTTRAAAIGVRVVRSSSALPRAASAAAVSAMSSRLATPTPRVPWSPLTRS